MCLFTSMLNVSAGWSVTSNQPAYPAVRLVRAHPLSHKISQLCEDAICRLGSTKERSEERSEKRRQPITSKIRPARIRGPQNPHYPPLPTYPATYDKNRHRSLPIMSRFFHGGLSDSESSSSDEEELYSEEESEAEDSSSEEESAEEEEASDDDSDEEGGSRFLRGAESDDSDDDEGKRTVKSAKDKRQDEIEGMVKAIENAQKINDWVTISAGMFLSVLFSVGGAGVVDRGQGGADLPAMVEIS